MTIGTRESTKEEFLRRASEVFAESIHMMFEGDGRPAWWLKGWLVTAATKNALPEIEAMIDAKRAEWFL